VVAGERVIRVPQHLMGASRRGERQPGKSDRIDALAVARAVLREGIERFPVAFLDEQAMQIRLIADHRDDLVAERTRAEPAALAFGRAVPRAASQPAQALA
jgi:transposase